ncbi:hypothetical protein PFISCL1PPCAC_27806, partial [Pristionchus fissidentatus]
KYSRHIREHMEDKIELPSRMKKMQSRFLYFEMHDLNKDNAIDGIELLKMMSHDHGKGVTMFGAPVKNEELMIERIDKTLADIDFDGNGFITFSEFSLHQ